MLVGYMRVSSDSDRQITDLQHDALLAAGVDARHLFEAHTSGAQDDRPGFKAFYSAEATIDGNRSSHDSKEAAFRRKYTSL